MQTTRVNTKILYLGLGYIGYCTCTTGVCTCRDAVSHDKGSAQYSFCRYRDTVLYGKEPIWYIYLHYHFVCTEIFPYRKGPYCINFWLYSSFCSFESNTKSLESMK